MSTEQDFQNTNHVSAEEDFMRRSLEASGFDYEVYKRTGRYMKLHSVSTQESESTKLYARMLAKEAEFLDMMKASGVQLVTQKTRQQGQTYMSYLMDTRGGLTMDYGTWREKQSIHRY